MRKMSIAELREKEVYRLASYRENEPSAEIIADARKIMNSFYRLCGLCEKNLYLANDERTCNSRYCKESEKREEQWVKRIDKWLEPYGLTLFFCGYCPSIGTVEKESGGCSEKITRWFYD